MQERMRHSIAFHAEMVGDTMHFHQALKQSDNSEFVKTVVKEINDHVENNHWELIKRLDVPKDQEVIPSVWAMRQKKDLTTNEITKYKARLNVHGGKQTFGINYFDTYVPVATWFAIRLLMVFAILFGWHLWQIDFVMTYAQAPIEFEMYMELPHGIKTKYGDKKSHVLCLLSNLYGQKQAGWVWNKHLYSKLLKHDYHQSSIDECVYYKNSTIFICYIDDGLFLGKSDCQLLKAIQELQSLGLDIEDQGHPADYVGANILKSSNRSYEFSQRGLKESIVKDIGLTHSRRCKSVVPVSTSKPMCIFIDFKSFYDYPKFKFNYCSVVGKLNYVGQISHPDIIYGVHQLA